MRVKVLGYAARLVANAASPAMAGLITAAAVERLMDPDDRVRIAAVAAVAGIAQAAHRLVAGRPLEGLICRLRDKRLPVRREVATHLADLMRTWCLQHAAGAADLPSKNDVRGSGWRWPMHGCRAGAPAAGGGVGVFGC